MFVINKTTVSKSLIKGLVLFLLLSFPVFFFQECKIRLQAPGARSGDEPHYLVLASSIYHDFDLAVSNNYSSPDFARGIYLSHFRFDHHSVFIHKKTKDYIRWDQVFDMELQKEPHPHVIFKAKPGFEHFQKSRYDEIGWHPMGYPALLAATMLLLVDSSFRYYESIIILLQLLLYVYVLLRAARNYKFSFLWLVVIAMALPSWYYNSSFYTEGIAGSFLLLAYINHVEKKTWACSVFLGLLLFIKESYAPVVVIFFLLEAWQTRSIKKSISILLFPLFSILLFILRSWILYNTFFQTYLPWMWNPNMFDGFVGTFLAPTSGLFIYTPIFICFLGGLVLLLIKKRNQGILLASIFFCHYFIVSMSVHWSGGPTFANRLMVPVTLLLLPSFFEWLVLLKNLPSRMQHTFLQKLLTNSLRYGTLFLVLVSFSTGFYGATHLRTAYASPPYLNIFSPNNSRFYERFVQDDF